MSKPKGCPDIGPGSMISQEEGLYTNVGKCQKFVCIIPKISQTVGLQRLSHSKITGIAEAGECLGIGPVCLRPTMPELEARVNFS